LLHKSFYPNDNLKRFKNFIIKKKINYRNSSFTAHKINIIFTFYNNYCYNNCCCCCCCCCCCYCNLLLLVVIIIIIIFASNY